VSKTSSPATSTTEWTKCRKMRRAFERECASYGANFIEITGSAPIAYIAKSTFHRAWRNRHFLAQLYCEQTGYLRLTVQRCAINNDGSWVGGITWDELMAVKSAVGLDDRWAVEVYPPALSVVNVANMRHLFLLPEAPAYAWRPNAQADRAGGKDHENGK